MRRRARIRATRPPLTWRDHPENAAQFVAADGDGAGLRGLEPGDVRLVAWRSEGLPGLHISPASNQSAARRWWSPICSSVAAHGRADMNLRTETRPPEFNLPVDTEPETGP